MSVTKHKALGQHRKYLCNSTSQYLYLFMLIIIIMLNIQQNEETSSHFSGCLGSVVLNGDHLNLWSLATDTGQLDLHTCSRSMCVTAGMEQQSVAS